MLGYMYTACLIVEKHLSISIAPVRSRGELLVKYMEKYVKPL
jgi:hypothetical protein